MSGNQNCRTPPAFFKAVQNFIGRRFTFDAACTREDCMCEHGFYYPEHDALTEPWPTDEVIWCCPPFRVMQPWAELCARGAYHGQTVGLLGPLSAAPWVEYCMEHATGLYLVYPRIQFMAAEGVRLSSNAKDNLLVIFEGRKQTQPLTPIEYFRWKRYV